MAHAHALSKAYKQTRQDNAIHPLQGGIASAGCVVVRSTRGLVG